MKRRLPYRSRGFTVLEVAIVIAIMAVLAALAIPAYAKIMSSSHERVIINNLRQISYGANNYFLVHGVDEVPVAQLVEGGSFVANFRPISDEQYPDVVRADDIALIAESARLGDIVFRRR
ncbi:MAG: prepilin-type N-terminal cleavage/methylation domain-containing protein [Opitutales bacterium]|nr:prepilin-type N-terminal cleavage/methylation domain-containing protein [Opitutales bacterium]